MAGVIFAGLTLAGCAEGGGDAGSPAPQPTGASLAGFDPCTILTPQQLQVQGVASQGKPVDQGLGEVGCDFDGDDLILTVLKAEQDNLASWQERRDNFDEFEPNQVGSRQGIRGIAIGGVGQGVCNQIVEAGSGSVDVVITYSSDKIAGKDPCAKALEIAQLIEPKLPK